MTLIKSISGIRGTIGGKPGEGPGRIRLEPESRLEGSDGGGVFFRIPEAPAEMRQCNGTPRPQRQGRRAEDQALALALPPGNPEFRVDPEVVGVELVRPAKNGSRAILVSAISEGGRQKLDRS